VKISIVATNRCAPAGQFVLHAGSNRIDESGFNRGYYELASGAEITSYFERVMRERFLPSGRVQYIPMCDHLGHARFRACLSGEVHEIKFRRKLVDPPTSTPRSPRHTRHPSKLPRA